jgi:hypothetical protein
MLSQSLVLMTEDTGLYAYTVDVSFKLHTWRSDEFDFEKFSLTKYKTYHFAGMYVYIRGGP